MNPPFVTRAGNPFSILGVVCSEPAKEAFHSEFRGR